MAMTQLEKFRATVAHEPHEGLLYKASFTPDLQARVFEAYGVADMAAFAEKVGMLTMPGIRPKAPEGHTPPDFSGYYEDMDQPEGSYIDGNGTLHIPGSMYHFTRYVSPLRNAGTFEDIESFTYPTVEGFTADPQTRRVTALMYV